MDYPTIVSQIIKTPPYRIGLALDHRWDRAWRLFYPELSPAKSEISKFLNKSFKILALETYYKTKEGKDCFFGFEYGQWSSLSHQEFIEKYFLLLTI